VCDASGQNAVLGPDQRKGVAKMNIDLDIDVDLDIDIDLVSVPHVPSIDSATAFIDIR